MKRILIAGLFAALALPGPLAASTAQVSFEPGALFGENRLYRRARIKVDGGAERGIRAGVFDLTGESLQGDFNAFGIEFGQRMRTGALYDAGAMTMPDAVLENLGRLFSVTLHGKSLGDAIPANRKRFAKNKAAGLQIAIWEILKDTGSDGLLGYDLDDGDFQVVRARGRARQRAERFLERLGNGDASQYRLTVMNSPQSRDLVTVAPVPLPASGLLFGFGLAGLALLGRRSLRMPSSGAA